MRAVLDRGGDVLVGRTRRLGEVVASALGLSVNKLGQPQVCVRRSSCVDRSTTTDLIIGCRKTISPAAVVDDDEMVALGRLRDPRDSLSRSSAARTARLPEPSSTASRSRRRVGSGRRSTLASYNVRTSRLDPEAAVA